MQSWRYFTGSAERRQGDLAIGEGVLRRPRMKAALCGVALFAACVPLAAAAQAPSQVQAITPIATPAEPQAIPLLDKRPAGPGEEWESFAGGRIVRNVDYPTLTPFLPDPAKATGAAVIVAPGGGFMMLSIDNEGYDVARWLADHGVAAFVLKYRLNPTPRDSAAYMLRLQNLFTTLRSGNPAKPETPANALADAQAAVRLVRARSAEWKVDPKRVGFLGFSAGAMTTISVGLSSDAASRPDFIAPIYGPLVRQDLPASPPPMFTVISADDPLIRLSGAELVLQYHQANLPVEFHLYEHGGHGFGMHKQGTTSDLWITEFYEWMKARGELGPKAR